MMMLCSVLRPLPSVRSPGGSGSSFRGAAACRPVRRDAKPGADIDGFLFGSGQALAHPGGPGGPPVSAACALQLLLPLLPLPLFPGEGLGQQVLALSPGGRAAGPRLGPAARLDVGGWPAGAFRSFPPRDRRRPRRRTWCPGSPGRPPDRNRLGSVTPTMPSVPASPPSSGVAT